MLQWGEHQKFHNCFDNVVGMGWIVVSKHDCGAANSTSTTQLIDFVPNKQCIAGVRVALF